MLTIFYRYNNCQEQTSSFKITVYNMQKYTPCSDVEVYKGMTLSESTSEDSIPLPAFLSQSFNMHA